MKRGRKSSAELAVVAGFGPRRPEPPAELTADQAAEWQAVVARLPADWFPAETHALLAAYCRHVVTLRMLSGELDAWRMEWTRGEAGDEGLKRLDRLTAMRERESRAMIAAARALRLTKTSQVRPEAAGRMARDAGEGRRKPWEG